MKARELIAELQKLSDEEQELDITMEGCDCVGECATVAVDSYARLGGEPVASVLLGRPHDTP